MLFTQISSEHKINFFLACQELLTTYHPDSNFIFRADNKSERLTHVRSFIDKYKGFVYQSAHVCALYNKIIITKPSDPIHDFRAAMYTEPAEHYNTISVDFVAFRSLEDCKDLIADAYDSKVQHIIFVRHGKIKLYPALPFMTEGLKIPAV